MVVRVAVDFEVFGKVQGVFFRKHTQKKGKALGLRGWIRNTSDLTVKGQIEGTIESVETMKNWLSTEGSPKSRIDRAEFTNEKKIKSYTLDEFTIVRWKSRNYLKAEFFYKLPVKSIEEKWKCVVQTPCLKPDKGDHNSGKVFTISFFFNSKKFKRQSLTVWEDTI